MSDKNDKNVLKTGTTTLAFKVKDGIILASDSRATAGHFIATKKIQKVHPVGPKKVMTVAGSVGDAQTLVRWVKTQLKNYKIKQGKPMSTKAAASLLSNIMFSQKYYPFLVQLLIAGYEKEPKIFALDPLGGITEESYVSTGSGSPIAYGLLESSYKEDISLEDGLKLATKSISVAMERDSATGNYISLVSISKDGIKRYTKEEIKTILNK